MKYDNNNKKKIGSFNFLSKISLKCFNLTFKQINTN